MSDEERWEKHARDELEPMVRDSAVMVTLWDGKIDPKIALETGYAVLLDKPFVVAVTDLGKTAMPENLRRLARHVIERDFKTDEGRNDLANALREIVDNMKDDSTTIAE